MLEELNETPTRIDPQTKNDIVQWAQYHPRPYKLIYDQYGEGYEPRKIAQQVWAQTAFGYKFIDYYLDPLNRRGSLTLLESEIREFRANYPLRGFALLKRDLLNVYDRLSSPHKRS